MTQERLGKLRPRTWIVRTIVAAFCALGFALTLSVAIPSPAQAAVSCTPYKQGIFWYVNWGCKSVPIPASHRCMSYTQGAGLLRSPGVYEDAIECADLYVTNDNPDENRYELWGEGEFYCQGARHTGQAYYQCDGMNVNVGVAHAAILSNGSTGVGTADPARNYKCNPTVGACPANDKVWWASNHFGYFNVASCEQTYAYLPVDNVIAFLGVAIHTQVEWDSYTVNICFNNKPLPT